MKKEKKTLADHYEDLKGVIPENVQVERLDDDKFSVTVKFTFDESKNTLTEVLNVGDQDINGALVIKIIDAFDKTDTKSKALFRVLIQNPELLLVLTTKEINGIATACLRSLIDKGGNSGTPSISQMLAGMLP